MPMMPDDLNYQLDYLKVHKELQESILRDITRRIIKTDFSISDTANWQTEVLQESGVLYSDITKEIAKTTKRMESEICEAFEDANTKVFDYDEELIVEAGYDIKKVTNISPAMKKIIQSTLAKSSTEAINLTKTTAITSKSAYISACDLAHMQVTSGAFSYQEAIKNAVKSAARQGVTVIYPTGYKSSLDAAVRRSVLTGVNQTAGTLQEIRANELDVDIMEITAHSGARDDHATWQGKLVSRSGQKGYLSLSDIGYGSVTGFMGANCRHNWHMFFPGISKRNHTDEELEQMQNETVMYNGQETKKAEALSHQRAMERSIRQSKQELVMFDEARKNVTTDEEKALWNAEFEKSAVKLKGQEAKLKDFCKQTGLKRDRYREQVFAKETENGIKNWGKSVSQKAVQANLTKQRQNAIIEAIKSSGIKGEKINYPPKKIDNNNFIFEDSHINTQRGHNVTEKQAISYIKNAKFSITGWKGRREKYFSFEGAAYVDIETNTICTAFCKDEYDTTVKNALKEYVKNGGK